MITTKKYLLNRKIKFNIDGFLKSRVTPKIYFKYFFEKPPIQKEYDFNYIQFPKIKHKFN